MPHPDKYLGKLIATMALGTLCGCTDEPVFEKLFSTDHFDYYIEQGTTPPCDGTGEWLERYYAVNTAFLGAKLPSGKKIEYYRVGSSQSMAAVGCPDLGGCAQSTRIYDLFPLTPHEIVHANAYSIGEPPALFQEGLAEVLGCRTMSDIEGPLDISDPIEDLMETRAFVEWRAKHGYGVYRTAASLVRHLIDTFGVEKFLAFYAHTPLHATRAEIAGGFEQEFGMPIGGSLSDWRKVPASLPGDLCLRLMECDSTMPLLVDGNADFKCGPWGGFGPSREALFRFQIADGKTMRVTTAPLGSNLTHISTANFYRCGGGNLSAFGELTFGATWNENNGLTVDPARATLQHALDAPPGDYIAWFISEAETAIHVELEQSGSPMRDGCAPTASPLPLVESQELVLTTRWTDRSCAGFWCPGHGWDIVIGSNGGAIGWDAYIINGIAPFLPEKVYLCSDPCPADANQCETLTLDTSTGKPVQSKQIFAPGTIVHVGAPLAPLKEHFSLRMRIVPPCNGRVPCTDPWHGPR